MRFFAIVLACALFLIPCGKALARPCTQQEVRPLQADFMSVAQERTKEAVMFRDREVVTTAACDIDGQGNIFIQGNYAFYGSINNDYFWVTLALRFAPGPNNTIQLANYQVVAISQDLLDQALAKKIMGAIGDYCQQHSDDCSK